MIRGTTPTITLTVDGYDLTEKSVEIYIREKDAEGEPLTYTEEDQAVEILADAEKTTIYLHLSQENTLEMKAGKSYQVQVRWIGEDGIAEATEKGVFTLGDIMKNAEIKYRGGE